MALIPFADHQLIPAGPNDPRITPVIGILHVDAANAYNLHDYFDGPSGGIESHCHIAKDGHLFQYRDTRREADANYQANSWWSEEHGTTLGALSFETQGYGEGEWTDDQILTIKRCMLWALTAHNIPLQPCAAPFSPGWGYHTMWGAPSAWTPVAKSCPGPDRIQQFHDILVPWMKSPEEDDMEYKDWSEASKRALVTDVIEGLLATDLFPRDKNKDFSVRDSLRGWKPSRNDD
jgi:hypothetical protein